MLLACTAWENSSRSIGRHLELLRVNEITACVPHPAPYGPRRDASSCLSLDFK